MLYSLLKGAQLLNETKVTCPEIIHILCCSVLFVCVSHSFFFRFLGSNSLTVDSGDLSDFTSLNKSGGDSADEEVWSWVGVAL